MNGVSEIINITDIQPVLVPVCPEKLEQCKVRSASFSNRSTELSGTAQYKKKF